MDLFSIVGQLLAGWLLADLLGGAVHWFEDRVAHETTPLIGRHVVQPNRLHHRDPMHFTRAGFLVRNSTTFAAAAVFAFVWLALLGPSLILITAAIGGALTNEVHRFAHEPLKAPRSIRVLQEIGFLQSPAHHNGHHRAPSDRRYCALTDWLNPALDALRVWTLLEQLLESMGVRLSLGES